MHKLLSKDLDTLIGECSECGPVKIMRDRRGKYIYYRCVTPVYARNNKARGNFSDYKASHGLTRDEAKAFVSDKPCEICGEIREKMCVDHCHNSNRIRGVLCNACNMALGIMKDDIERLQNAIAYLTRNPE